MGLYLAKERDAGMLEPGDWGTGRGAPSGPERVSGSYDLSDLSYDQPRALVSADFSSESPHRWCLGG